MFTLAISCLITSNLPWFMELTFQVPLHYCSLQHRTLLLSPVTSTTGYCFCFGSIPSFFLGLFLHWSPVAYWAPTHPGSSSFSILSFCLFILFMGFSRQEFWMVCLSLFQWTTFCLTSPPWPIPLGWPHMAWLSFIELDKAVVHVIRLTSFLWLWFQCVCPLMPSHNTYRLTLVSLILDMGYLFMAAPAKCSHCSLPWTWDISSWPLLLTLDWTWGISTWLLLLTLNLGYLLSAAAPYLGCGVAHLSCSSGPWTWGISSWPLLLTFGLGCLLLAAAPDRGCRVSPLGRSCAAQPPMYALVVLCAVEVSLLVLVRISSFRNAPLAFDHSNHTLEAVTKQLIFLYRQWTSEAFLFNVRNITF